MGTTAQLGLTTLTAGQASAELAVNEALRKLDAVVQLSVKDRDLTAAPGSPTEGDRYIVGASATGDWSGHDGKVAAYLNSAWTYFAPREGWLAWVDDENASLVYDGSAWVAFVTAALANDSVTYAKIQNVSATDRLLGRSTVGAGDVEEIPCTAAARTVLDDATVSAMLDTLGGASATGTGGVVRATSPTLVTPALGTPSAAVLTNATGLPVGSGIAGLGSGIATFLATPTSANLAAAVSDDLGTGLLEFQSVTTDLVADPAKVQGAIPCPSTYNHVATCATAGDTVSLVGSVVGTKRTIVNRGATRVDVYPPSGHTIDGGAANAISQIATNAKKTFVLFKATDWLTI